MKIFSKGTELLLTDRAGHTENVHVFSYSITSEMIIISIAENKGVRIIHFLGQWHKIVGSESYMITLSEVEKDPVSPTA
ncbi:hypothetical protein H6761_01420 [Candidatus Nomurabacteria bacterium]|nr:hypothetical protein [Candidatus Nomurabacteria bacterium]